MWCTGVVPLGSAAEAVPTEVSAVNVLDWIECNYLPEDRLPAISVLHQSRVYHLHEVALVLGSRKVHAL